jgi:quinoprotein glucose dehydrogenase
MSRLIRPHEQFTLPVHKEFRWQYKLPAGGYATPNTYMLNGRQYIVIACGGGGKLLTKSGDSYVAFALTETTTR